MTNSSPPERPSPRTKPLKKDEKIALVVAFLAFGSILFWAFNRGKAEFDLAGSDSLNTLTRSPAEWKFPPVLKPTSDDGVLALLQSDRDGDVSADTDLEDDESATETEAGDSSFDALKPIAPILPVVGALTLGEEAAGETATATDETPADDEVAIPLNEATTIVVPEGEGEVQAPVEVPIATPQSPQPSESETQINPDLPPPDEPVEFADVPPDYWAFPFISGLSSRKVIAGFQDGENATTFQPDAPVNRAELAIQIEKLFDLQDKQPKLDFTDITQDFWAAGAIEESNKANFLNGYPEGDFRPARTIPRLELLIALATGLGLQLPENPDAVLAVYEDADTVPDWAKPKIAAATQAGLVASYPNRTKLELDREATRAEVVAMMYQALVRQGAAEPLESEYLVPASP